MANKFVYKDFSCELDFGNVKYSLPLNEDTADKITQLFENVTPPQQATKSEIDIFFDSVMDLVDELLGDGAADAIMAGFKHAGTMELLSVVNYVVTAYNAQYAAEVEEMKKSAQIAPQPNRAARRRK